jgi:hypothetical protein
VRLIDLEPQFIKWTKESYWRYVDSLGEAAGIHFLCPRCFETNGGPIGTHIILCWFRDRGVPDSEFPRPGRWIPSGSDYTNLTLSPSVNLPGAGCKWHGNIINGYIQNIPL